MKLLNKLFISLMVTGLVFTACSKSSDTETEGGSNPPVDNGNPSVKTYDTTLGVYNILINRFKGDNGSLLTENENNMVTFAIDFTAKKNGRISKLRANTGHNGTHIISLWRVGVKSDSTAYYKEASIATTNTTTWSGEIDVTDWDIKKDSTYRIGIRLNTKVRRLHQQHNINNASATVGTLEFGKVFDYNTDMNRNLLPVHVGNYKHFAGFLDFDFIAEN